MKILHKNKHTYMFDDGFEIPSGNLHVDALGYLTIVKYIANRKCSRTAIHRIIAGAKPGEIVDHINGDVHDNRSANLRIVDAKRNAWNRPARGCTYNKRVGKWQSVIMSDGKQYYLGLFKTMKEASSAYLGACRVLRDIQPRPR